MKNHLSINEIVAITTLLFNSFCASQEPDEVALLAEIAKELPSDGVYLEVGTRHGHSTISVALANMYIDVYGVDIDPNTEKEIEKTIKDLMGKASVAHLYNPEEWKVEERIKLIIGDSSEVAKTWTKPIDFLYIDGDHSYKGIMADIKAWTPFLKSNSFLGFHDYQYRVANSDTWGTTKAITEEIMVHGGTWRLYKVSSKNIIFIKR